MGEVKLKSPARVKKNCRVNTKKMDTKKWQKPTLEDVSGKIMAQPYIRFT